MERIYTIDFHLHTECSVHNCNLEIVPAAVIHVYVYIFSLQVETLLLIIWDSLIDLDDLSASTNSIMELLCTLLSCNPSLYSSPLPSAPPAQSLSAATGSNLATLVPRLWPFLAHTISSVRRSCLTAILTILTCGQHGDVSKDETPMDISAGDGDSKNESGIVVSASAGRMTWLKEVLQNMLCHVFQRFALEGVEENRELIHKVSESMNVCLYDHVPKCMYQ